MTRVARIISASRWRHFIPQADSFTVKIPFYEATRNGDGSISVIEKFRFEYVAPPIASNSAPVFFQFPSHAVPKSLNAISVSFNGIVQDNAEVILYFTSNPDRAIVGPRGFSYELGTNQLRYQQVTQTGINRAPTEGTAVVIEILNELDTDNLYVRLPLKKSWLIQGANPIDPSLVDEDGTGTNQFQGGYRCTLKLISRAAHGHARISDDKLAFEYRPDMGYFGVDAFAFKLVNALGQESPAYCINLDVGTNTL